MAFDLNNWVGELQKAGQLTDEQAAAMKGALTPGAVKFLEESQLRQSDYSRAMNSLKEKETATTALQGELVKWKADQEKVIQSANLTARQEREQRAILEAKVKAAAETYGLDATEILGTTPPPAVTPPAVTPPAGDFVAKADWEKELAAMRGNLPFLPAILHDLSVQHQTLFGKPLDNSRSIVQKAIETGKAIETVWAEEFKVAERQQQIQEESIQQRIRQGVEAEVAKFRSENNIPAPAPASARSPILAEFKPPAQNRSQMDAVDAAVARYTELASAGTAGSPVTSTGTGA